MLWNFFLPQLLTPCRQRLATGAAEKAVSRQNEFAVPTQLGETAYQRFGNPAPAPGRQCARASGPDTVPGSFSHPTGLQTSPSGLAVHSPRWSLVPQGPGRGPAGNDVESGPIRGRTLSNGSRLLRGPAPAQPTARPLLGRFPKSPRAPAPAGLACLGHRRTRADRSALAAASAYRRLRPPCLRWLAAGMST